MTKREKFTAAKKKLSEVVEQMYILKNGLEDPDSIPIDG